MNRLLLTSALALSLGCGFAAQAQTAAPVGGPDAKGNAPIKHAHTVNDGSARPGANSFTEGQARQHILNSGYTDVTGLAKGKDGVWRGMATHNGASVPVAMDFKGNVTEGAAGGGSSSMTSTSKATSGSATAASAADQGGATTSSEASGAGAAAGGSGAGSGAGEATMHHRRHHHHRHHGHGRCAHPGPNGAACSGVSTERSGVSDKEVHAMQNGAHP
jgi:hypothetical protein